MRLTILLCTVLASSVVARADTPDPQAIDARVREYADANLFSGVVLVAQGDRILFEKAYGLADRAFGVPNTPATKFHIASLSKPITAAAVLLLVDRGKLSLDDKLAK